MIYFQTHKTTMIIKPSLRNRKQSVMVAMSGGVDSSVAAALLKKKGFDVKGVFIKVWSDPELPCTQKEDRLDAMRVALQLKIPFEVWDFTREYKRKVVDYMIESYRKGVTPNPDVMCNKHIKFGLFLKKALKEGVDFIATGHYVRKFSISEKVNGKFIIRYGLKVAKDSNKDQSYFLWTLTQDQLAKCIFPIGDYLKKDVRKIAEKFGLATADKKDSQGICFLGEIDLKNFLKKYILVSPGSIQLSSGEIIGKHEGLPFYTIGQRKGIGLSGGPYFVLKKDFKRNTLIVTKKETELFSSELRVEKVNWIRGMAPLLPLSVIAKPRYLAEGCMAILDLDETKRGLKIYKLKFEKPQRAIASGQSVVFYKEEELLGGGIII